MRVAIPVSAVVTGAIAAGKILEGTPYWCPGHESSQILGMGL